MISFNELKANTSIMINLFFRNKKAQLLKSWAELECYLKT